jgi:chemotaxis protein MotB
MWLLGASSTARLAGIADYFQQPLTVSLVGGKKTSDSASVLDGGGTDLTRHDGERKRLPGDVSKVDQTSNAAAGTPVIAPGKVDQPVAEQAGAGAEQKGQKQAQIAAAASAATGDAGSEEDANLRGLQARLEAALANNSALKPFRSQIMMDVTRYGLRVQIVDARNRPMFANARAEVEPYMRDILRELGPVLNGVPNKIVLEGHTDAQPYAGGAAGYSNWELSADRANASRRELDAGGMSDSKVLRVIGLAATSQFNPNDAFDPRNRRISILVLNRRTELQLEADHARPTAFGGGAAAGDPPGDPAAGPSENVKNATAAAATAKSTAESTAESTASAAVANASNVTTGSNGSAAPAISKRTAAEQGAEQITKQDNVMSRQESPKATPTFNKP